MILDIVWLPRILSNDHWAAYLWVVCLVCLVIAKYISESGFFEFLSIFSNDKYLKSNYENRLSINWFLVVLYILNLIVLSFVLLIMADYWSLANKENGIDYLKIFTVLSTFMLSKQLVEKIVATSFDIEEATSQYNFHKLSYQTYVGVLLMPLAAIVYYLDRNQDFWVFFLALYAVLLIVFAYIKTTLLHQNWLFSRLFYFILYLCTLEIAPFYFIGYWLKKI
ncbi:MAG: DUF4271 domain-containing protein [Flavobacterium sp.]